MFEIYYENVNLVNMWGVGSSLSGVDPTPLSLFPVPFSYFISYYLSCLLN